VDRAVADEAAVVARAEGDRAPIVREDGERPALPAIACARSAVIRKAMNAASHVSGSSVRSAGLQ
jgi:hypothetical protein